MAKHFRVDKLDVAIYPTREEMGKEAARYAAAIINGSIAEKGKARVVFASAPSQLDFISELINIPLDWSKVVAFNQDEYVGAGLAAAHSFGKYINDKLYERVHPGETHFLRGDAQDMDAECARFAQELFSEEIDLFLLGIGENCHIAFNEPHEADFHDKRLVKIISLDETCKQQQKNDFGFATEDDVPRQGVTVSIPGILKAKHLLCVVPTARKAQAVQHTLREEISERYPATVLRTHENAALFLDGEAAKLLK